MYNRFRRCGSMPFNNNQVLEDICDDVTDISNTNCCNMSNCTINEYNCNCGFDEEVNVFPLNPMLAQSYVPIQTLDKTFTPCCGLKNGTIFPELVNPYEPCQNMKFNQYLIRRNQIGEGCNG